MKLYDCGAVVLVALAIGFLIGSANNYMKPKASPEIHIMVENGVTSSIPSSEIDINRSIPPKTP